MNSCVNIILLGPPGAGKGTQAHLLEHQHGIAQIATGDMLRAAIRKGDAFGLEAKKLIAMGNLVPDTLMIKMIEERIGRPDCARGFILDGFPRTVPQADALDKMLAAQGKKLCAVIELEVDEGALIERISGRFTCTHCGASYHAKYNPPARPDICDECGGREFAQRPDDNAESLKTRLKVFWEQTQPILPYYKSKGILHHVNGMDSVELVHQAINHILPGLCKITAPKYL